MNPLIAFFRWVWRGPGVVEVDDVSLRQASGSGDDNNCLIDSLRQVLRISGDASVSEQVRQSLREQQVANRGDVDFVEASNFLTMDLHWRAVVRCLAQVTGTDVSADQLTVVCVTREHAQEHGMVEGTGPRVVLLLNSGNYHIDPLLPADE